MHTGSVYNHDGAFADARPHGAPHDPPVPPRDDFHEKNVDQCVEGLDYQSDQRPLRQDDEVGWVSVGLWLGWDGVGERGLRQG